MTTVKDEEADSKLSEILKTASGGRANASQLASTSSHLWVWQSSSGEDPAGHASIHKDTLVQRLQNDGIAAVMQSATDQRVRERIAVAHDALFTGTGKPKAGSKPELARTNSPRKPPPASIKRSPTTPAPRRKSPRPFPDSPAFANNKPPQRRNSPKSPNSAARRKPDFALSNPPPRPANKSPRTMPESSNISNRSPPPAPHSFPPTKNKRP